MVALTNLKLEGIGVPPYSARGVTQTLSPITQAAQLKRTINGVLKDLSSEQFQKYASTISATDQLAPSCDGVWPGKEVVVDCISELCYLTAGGTPQRTVVAGSSRVEGDYTYYRPQLTMRVLSFSSAEDEWARSNNWSMQLEEV
jgi:hypothetical protein